MSGVEYAGPADTNELSTRSLRYGINVGDPIKPLLAEGDFVERLRADFESFCSANGIDPASLSYEVRLSKDYEDDFGRAERVEKPQYAIWYAVPKA